MVKHYHGTAIHGLVGKANGIEPKRRKWKIKAPVIERVVVNQYATCGMSKEFSSAFYQASSNASLMLS